MCQVEIIFIRKMGAGMGPARRGRELCGKDLCEDDIEAATGGEKGTKLMGSVGHWLLNVSVITAVANKLYVITNCVQLSEETRFRNHFREKSGISLKVHPSSPLFSLNLYLTTKFLG